MIKTYSLANNGNEQLTPNFKVKEFACHDGSDKIIIDTDLVACLQVVREHFKKPVIINSAYRTPSYNKKVGGSSTSYHMKGQAADIQIRGVSPVLIGLLAEEMKAEGIGLYAYADGGGFVHVDTRPTPYRWLQLTKLGSSQGIAKILPTLKIGGKANTMRSVALLQRQLGLDQDGMFGGMTDQKVRDFQMSHNLVVDGIVGNKTWKALFA